MTADPAATGRVRGERAPAFPIARTPVRLAVTLVLASGLALAGACGNPSPDALLPAANPAATPPPGGPTTTPPASSTPAPATPPISTPAPSPVPDPAEEMLQLESSGPTVLELQQRLSGLGYWLGELDGHFGQLTRQAVLAFQKAEGLTRDGVAGPKTREQIPTADRPTPRFAEGEHIEIDLERQLLFVVRNGEVQWTFNTSTGNGEAYDRPSGGTGVARTPRGDYEIERQIDGVREAELGTLYRPKYFHGGIAVHGSGSIPAEPASHGCVRVTNAAMDLLWASDVAPVGTEVTVY
jgi:peptidoglycan hydrolase-like protein with peptidoglycan-binding domain